MSWLGWALISAGMWALAIVAVSFPRERRRWRDARALIASVRADSEKAARMPQRIPLGDYVPDDWVAEYRRQNRGRP